MPADDYGSRARLFGSEEDSEHENLDHELDVDASEESSERVAPLASIIEILDAAGKLTTDLEEHWSEALNSESFKSGREELKARWAAVLHLIAEHLSSIDEGLKRQDLRVIQFGYPAGLGDLADLSSDQPSPDQAWRQMQLAVVYATDRLARAVAFLDNESAHRLSFSGDTATESRWWQAGAFGLIKERAGVLARLLKHEIGILERLQEAELFSGELPPREQAQLPASWETMKLAGAAMSRGMYEAALVYELRWMRAVVAEAMDCSLEEVPSPLAPAIADLELLREFANPVALLESLCIDLGQGRDIDLAVSTVLAEVIYESLSDLLLQFPEPTFLDE